MRYFLLWLKAAVWIAAALVGGTQGHGETLIGRVLEDDASTGIPYARVVIRNIHSAVDEVEFETGKEGRFQAAQLVAGQSYRLELSKESYMKSVVEISTLTPSPEELIIRMLRLGAISGQVYDTQGAILKHGRVIAFRQKAGHFERYGVEVNVDSQGRYRVSGLPPGRYAMGLHYAAGGDGGNTNLVFYPAASASTARLILLAAGGDVSGIDFAVAPSPTFSVSGRSTLPDGAPAAGFSLSLSLSDPPGYTLSTVLTDGDGRFRFDGVSAGDYVLTAAGPVLGRAAQGAILQADALFGRTPVTIAASDLAEVNVGLARTESSDFILNLEGGGDGGKCPNRVQVKLQPVQTWGAMIERTLELQEKRKTTISALPPGQYIIDIQDAGGCTIRSVESQGRRTSEPIVDLPSRKVAIGVGGGKGSIRGMVLTGDRLSSRIAVLMVPEQASNTDEPMLIALLGSDNNYEFKGIRSGKYRASAVRLQSGSGESLAQGRWTGELATSLEVTIPADSEVQLDLTLPRPQAGGQRP